MPREKVKSIFKGKILNVYLKRHKFPNGYVTDLEIVKHIGAVLIVPFLSKEKIVFIKQYRPVINSYIWELPAGTLSKGESVLLCAKRELIEEVGYAAGKWKKIGFIYPAPGYTTEKITIFKAYDLKKVDSVVQEDEMISVKVLSVKEIKKLFYSGKIVDAKTISALKMAKVI
ncbi:MAG: NUDIX hydrolase [Candidatus Omnitrophica bacterium]|nr:NUDIX hydrolase [Candidatus Omnitrophota bacterium]